MIDLITELREAYRAQSKDAAYLMLEEKAEESERVQLRANLMYLAADALEAVQQDVATANATALRAPTRIYHLYLTRMGDVVMDSHLYDHPPEKWLHLGPIEVVETK